jgi:OPT family oligopeptide transporter
MSHDAHSPNEAPKDFPNLLDVPEEDRERVWFETVYRGDDVAQLTPRAVIMGMVLGSIMSLSNLYVGLKTGWGLGVAITSCILSYAVWETFLKLGLAKTPMTDLENNCMQSAASSAGYSTGGTMVSAIAAYLLITKQNMPFWVLFFWTAFLALLGVAIAVPMKRQMINREQLMFPSGVAAAETLRSLHAAGGEAMLKARALFRMMGAGALIKWLIEGHGALMAKLKAPELLQKLVIPGDVHVPGTLAGKPAASFGLALPIDPMMMAAGAIVGLRTSLSMAAGALFLYGVMGPILDSHGIFREMHALGALASPNVSASAIRKWGLWAGSAMMVSAGLTSFAFQWKSLARAFGSIGKVFSKQASTGDDPLEAIEVPTSWFVIGTLVAGGGCMVIMHTAWGVPYHWGVVAIAFAFVLSLVACRATGETDITPIGAMGKITQLFYGVTMPQNAIANLMTAGVTAGAAGSSADLLTDLKSGYLLGANPRKQTIAQALGIIAGTLVVVPVWYVLVPDASAIGSESKNFAAPAAEVWAAVAKLLSQGLSSLHPTILMGMGVGAAVGVILPLLEKFAPKARPYLPSATGLGLAFVIGFADSMAFLIGAVAAHLYAKRSPEGAERYVVPVSSGIIAGESIMGIVIALLGAFKIL